MAILRMPVLGDLFVCPNTGRVIEGSRGDDKVLCLCKKQNPVAPRESIPEGSPFVHHHKRFLKPAGTVERKAFIRGVLAELRGLEKGPEGLRFIQVWKEGPDKNHEVHIKGRLLENGPVVEIYTHLDSEKGALDPAEFEGLTETEAKQRISKRLSKIFRI